ncbi:hypothetical protein [Caulobacter endophyticus]|uniref:hypothetical protein n=1 Tax=Caulobacter endophyticus TaxID=2172652 RepID=UPI0024101A47|nr:hypothetical protein [Caulobacter endophyticus]MDG2529211.1 hypothetical protein [Caulobacter endophyticus]
MQRTGRRTTPNRVFLATIFSFAAPSVILSQAVYWSIYAGQPSSSLNDGLTLIPVMVVFGAFIGWPFVLVAMTAWAILDRFNIHYAWAAALVGTATGLTVAWYTLRQKMLPPDLAWPLCIGAGLFTALGVWWIAYGRQGALKRPAPPRRAPLTL